MGLSVAKTEFRGKSGQVAHSTSRSILQPTSRGKHHPDFYPKRSLRVPPDDFIVQPERTHAMETPGSPVKLPLCLTPALPNSVALGWSQEFAFLTSFPGDADATALSTFLQELQV